MFYSCFGVFWSLVAKLSEKLVVSLDVAGFGRPEVAFFIAKTVLFANLSEKLIVNHGILTILLKN